MRIKYDWDNINLVMIPGKIFYRKVGGFGKERSDRGMRMRGDNQSTKLDVEWTLLVVIDWEKGCRVTLGWKRFHGFFSR